jgi:hypothetical protein
LSVLNWLRRRERLRVLEPVPRVLLNCYRGGKMWIYVTDENGTSIQPMLLEALKDVESPELRRQIEDALAVKTGKKKSKAGLEASNAVEKKITDLKCLKANQADFRALCCSQ